LGKKISIDPITRLEGHGKIDIFLNDSGDVENAYLQVPELRGFEVFAKGRPAEEMPRITPKICGVCPTAHHICSAKTLDMLYDVQPPPAAKKIRELMYCAFMMESHTLHFFFLGAPDFISGPDAPADERNILGVLKETGIDAGLKVIRIRKKLRDIISYIGGRVIHPVCGLPGGVSRRIEEKEKDKIVSAAEEAVEFAKFSLEIFNRTVLENKKYKQIITDDTYRHETNYMGLVDENNRVNFYDGKIRVVSPRGEEISRFEEKDYLDHITEHTESWSYIKFPYLKKIGWKGFTDGENSGVFRVAPLARLNASDGMATELAQKEYERMYETLGGKPAHNTLAYHWARLIEILYSAERMLQLARDKEITSPQIRNIPYSKPSEGIGVTEAPRGTLFHHYKTNEEGILTSVNLLVATVNNSAAICMSIRKAAEKLIKNSEVSEGILNRVEMAFRAYDPCLACATHSLPGQMPLELNIYNNSKEKIRTIQRKGRE